MLLSILVCALLLLVLGYFAVLVVGECAFWLQDRLSTRQAIATPSSAVRRERPFASR